MKAKNGFIFRRIHDGLIMGDEVILGVDYSTGVSRVDLPEYYEEIQDPNCIWEYPTNFKIKMNSDRFVAMVSEVNAIVPDVSQNVSMFGITEIYLDVIDDEFRTLLNYFGGEIYDRKDIK